MKYIIVKEKTPDSYTPAELSKIKLSDLPDVVKVYSDGKPKAMPPRVKAKRKDLMVTTWLWGNLSEGDKALVKEFYQTGHINEIINILAAAKVYPETICDTCYEGLKRETSINTKSALVQGIL